MDYKEISIEMYKQWKMLNVVVNKVTSQKRHGMKVTEQALFDLIEKQIDVEDKMNRLKLLVEKEINND